MYRITYLSSLIKFGMYTFMQINKKNMESTLPMLIISLLFLLIPIRINTIPIIRPDITKKKYM